MKVDDLMPSERQDDHLLAREKILARGVQKVAAELRLVDLVDFIAYIRDEQFANIEDIVNSSVELYFKPGTLTFGWAADLAIDWEAAPRIMLDMEFRHARVSVFFGLALAARHASVDIRCISFEEASPEPAENTRRLMAAMEDAAMTVVASAK